MKRYCLPMLLLLLISFFARAQTTAMFPLKLNVSGTYLIDHQNKPFLIKEISAWGLIQALSEKDESAFIDSVKRKGFNTLMVSIISYDTRFAGGPPNWQGISPFKTKWDFSTPNLEYFSHADRFLQMAKAKGMLVLLVPCYLGYKDDKNQGCWNELLDPANSVAKSRQYGQFLGKRYKDFGNIIWVAGGDNNGENQLYPHMDNVIQGIKEFDKQHLWTGHFSSGNWSSANPLYAKYIDVDGLYDFVEADLGTRAPQYKTELQHYGKGKMIFQLDQSYEHDIPHASDNENAQWIRRKNYDGLLSGCAGTSFCPGTKDNTGYVFTNWRPLMNTDGMQQMQYCFKIFGARAWSRLVPDTGATVINKGRGEYGSINYVCAAKASDGSTYIIYLPTSRTLTVNLIPLKMKHVNLWFYNPRNGEGKVLGTFPGNLTKTITPPSDGDWLLVMDNTDQKHRNYNLNN